MNPERTITMAQARYIAMKLAARADSGTSDFLSEPLPPGKYDEEDGCTIPTATLSAEWIRSQGIQVITERVLRQARNHWNYAVDTTLGIDEDGKRVGFRIGPSNNKEGDEFTDMNESTSPPSVPPETQAKFSASSDNNWGRGWFGEEPPMNDAPPTPAAPTGLPDMSSVTEEDEARLYKEHGAFQNSSGKQLTLDNAGPTCFENAVQAIISKFLTLFLHKHEDYGPGNIMDSALKDLLAGTEYASSAVEWGVLQRLGDKYHRLIHLYAGQASPNNESLDDSWNDVIGYALVALLVRKGWFSLPLCR